MSYQNFFCSGFASWERKPDFSVSPTGPLAQLNRTTLCNKALLPPPARHKALFEVFFSSGSCDSGHRLSSTRHTEVFTTSPDDITIDASLSDMSYITISNNLVLLGGITNMKKLHVGENKLICTISNEYYSLVEDNKTSVDVFKENDVLKGSHTFRIDLY